MSRGGAIPWCIHESVNVPWWYGPAPTLAAGCRNPTCQNSGEVVVHLVQTSSCYRVRSVHACNDTSMTSVRCLHGKSSAYLRPLPQAFWRAEPRSETQCRIIAADVLLSTSFSSAYPPRAKPHRLASFGAFASSVYTMVRRGARRRCLASLNSIPAICPIRDTPLPKPRSGLLGYSQGTHAAQECLRSQAPSLLILFATLPTSVMVLTTLSRIS